MYTMIPIAVNAPTSIEIFVLPTSFLTMHIIDRKTNIDTIVVTKVAACRCCFISYMPVYRLIIRPPYLLVCLF